MNYLDDEVLKAKAIATEQHKKQFYDNKPYMFHVEAVVNNVKKVTNSNQAIILAYLHDVVEDTDFTYDDVKHNFDDNMAYLVNILTDEEGHNRKERKRKTNEKLSKVSEKYKVALIVKISDRLANLEHSKLIGNKSKLNMYLKENDDFIKAVNREYIPKELIDKLKSYNNLKNKIKP